MHAKLTPIIYRDFTLAVPRVILDFKSLWNLVLSNPGRFQSTTSLTVIVARDGVDSTERLVETKDGDDSPYSMKVSYEVQKCLNSEHSPQVRRLNSLVQLLLQRQIRVHNLQWFGSVNILPGSTTVDKRRWKHTTKATYDKLALLDEFHSKSLHALDVEIWSTFG